MNLSEIRKEARENLSSKWQTAVVFMLVYSAIELAISFSYSILSFIPGISTLAYIAIIVISIPLSYGVFSTFIDIKRDKEINYLDYWSIAYKSFKRAWCITGNILKKIWVYFLVYVCLIFSIFIAIAGIATLSIIFKSETFALISCLVVPVILIAMIAVLVLLTIKYYYYVLSYFIAIDNPDMPAKDTVERSYELMQGHRAEYFLLNLSFIGWSILALFTLGIGYLWLIPYIYVSQIIFYEKLSGKQPAKITKNSTPVDVEAQKIEAPKETLSEKTEDSSTVENIEATKMEVSKETSDESVKTEESKSEDITPEEVNEEIKPEETASEDMNQNNDNTNN